MGGDIFDRFVCMEPIHAGMSGDRKYRVTKADGSRLLLRVSDIAEYDRKKAEYSMMERVYALGVLTPQPLGFGLCDDGKSCYSLSSWLDGESGESALAHRGEAAQYRLGIKSGELLRKIHTFPAPENAKAWSVRFQRKLQGWIDYYNEHQIKSENAEFTIKYLLENQSLPAPRSQTFCHGDFWVGNLIISANGEIGIIDYNYYGLGYGDPWTELVDAIIWGQEADSHFLTDLFNGYFCGEPPKDFFEILPYYFAYHALAVLCETDQSDEPEVGRRHMANVLRWFDNFRSSVPTWYLAGVTQAK